ncbi:hypothetical protein EJV47_06220 [Hymenobacter gummosus]|uniref:Uncharacterized protein n=1 Tax=Hymenobacter gummosus TaxID=1776032 RepID=A0A3S0IPY2_9BACT|nr:hypothetical protein [Hymenobacter gummosus]RTQ51397.1 hypothetical protein EJV47_06220 [Hymenobacter gummosus]
MNTIPLMRWVWPLGLLVSLQACRDPAPPAPAPCSAADRNPLRFTVTEAFGAAALDTLYTGGPVGFAGPGAPYTAWQWLVGPATTRDTRTFGLSFDRTFTGPLPVRLIARRPPNPHCPGDDGVDTLTRVFTFVPRDLQQYRPAVFGKFLGANTDTPRDTFTVSIYLGPNFDFPNHPGAPLMPYLSGLPKGCATPYFEVGIDWRGANATSGGCLGTSARAVLTTRDSIRIQYRATVLPQIIDKVFLGRRVR